jgi:hypothetical protein
MQEGILNGRGFCQARACTKSSASVLLFAAAFLAAAQDAGKIF